MVILLIGGSYFLFNKYSKPVTIQPVNTAQVVNCITGVDGNNGDNFCSNYHSASSKCQPRVENTYPDGCTK